jgi:hypothetical protein
MSIHPFPKQKPLPAPIEPYFSAKAPHVQPVRPLTALEQMYAYWGSDRA